MYLLFYLIPISVSVYIKRKYIEMNVQISCSTFCRRCCSSSSTAIIRWIIISTSFLLCSQLLFFTHSKSKIKLIFNYLYEIIYFAASRAWRSCNDKPLFASVSAAVCPLFFWFFKFLSRARSLEKKRNWIIFFLNIYIKFSPLIAPRHSGR